MKKVITIIWIFCQIFALSCKHPADDMKGLDINAKFRQFVENYKSKDTLIFINSSKKLETFIIDKIDSTVVTKNDYVITARPEKSISISYREFPIDRWAHHYVEMGSNNKEKKIRTEDDQLVTVTKYQNSSIPEILISFKNFHYLVKGEPELIREKSISLDSLEINNYYQFDLSDSAMLDNSTEIKSIFISPSKGLVAYKNKFSGLWVRLPK